MPIWVAGRQVTGEHTTPVTSSDGGDPLAAVAVADSFHVEDAVQAAHDVGRELATVSATGGPTRSTTSRDD